MSEPRIVIFDVETTGMDKQKDQIIELCMQFGLDNDAESRTWRMRPSVNMDPGAQAVHGISMDDLADCPPFSDAAVELRALFADADMLVGYNLRFDIDMLQAEYLRLRQPPVDLADKLIVDPFRLWQQCEPRSLMDAHKRFAGGEFESAHSAAADVAATGRVLRGMVKNFGLPQEWEKVADVYEPDRAFWIEGSKHLRWNDEDQVTIGFGKHAGTLLTELASGPEANYLRWIINKDFPAHVLETCRQALDLDAKDFACWAAERFGRTPSGESEVAVDTAAASNETGAQQTLF
jgi:DNA polymerase-3 subunit epsilon